MPKNEKDLLLYLKRKSYFYKVIIVQYILTIPAILLLLLLGYLVPDPIVKKIYMSMFVFLVMYFFLVLLPLQFIEHKFGTFQKILDRDSK